MIQTYKLCAYAINNTRKKTTSPLFPSEMIAKLEYTFYYLWYYNIVNILRLGEY